MQDTRKQKIALTKQIKELKQTIEEMKKCFDNRLKSNPHAVCFYYLGDLYHFTKINDLQKDLKFLIYTRGII